MANTFLPTGECRLIERARFTRLSTCVVFAGLVLPTTAHAAFTKGAEYFGVKGDLMTYAKSLANGYPLAAIGGRTGT